jgi:glycosyltransferase involved in cell wall biosynthesis
MMTKRTVACASSEAELVVPVRVAYVVHGLQTGGIERSVTRLVNALDREHFEPLVVCLDQSGPAADWIESDDVPIVELKKRSGNDLHLSRRLAGVFSDYGVDVAHSHNWGTLLETVLARRRAGTTVHVHAERGTVLGELNSKGLRTKLRGLAARWALRRTDAVVTNAHSVSERIASRCGYPAQSVRIIPNGVEQPFMGDAASARREVRRELGISDSAFVYGSLGRLATVKGFDIAVQSLAHLVAAACHDPHLVLIGDGPDRDRLLAEAARLGVSQRVHLVGHREDIGRWLCGLDVYINSSLSEGMSQSIVEAMASGLPVVATDVGDNRRVVCGDAECGKIVPPRDAQQLADTLGQLANSPDVRRALGAASRQCHAAQYSIAKMVQRYTDLYDELLTQKC